jgi:hypothetical protein
VAIYLKPKRGSATNASSQNIGLKKGELFLEFPEGRIGREPGRMVIGDGATSYQHISYHSTSTNEFQPFITDPSIYVPRFENTVPASTSSATFDWNSTTKAINEIGSGAATEENKTVLPKSIGAIKKSVSLLLNGLAKHESDIEALNSSTGGLSGKLSLNGGTMTGTIVTPADNTKGIIPKSDDSGLLGNQNKKFHAGYIKNIYSTNIECDNLKGLASTASIAINAGTSEYASQARESITATTAINANNASTATYATNASSVNGHTVDINVPSNAKFTDEDHLYYVKSGLKTLATSGNNTTFTIDTAYAFNLSAATVAKAGTATTANSATNASTAEYSVKANAATNASTAEYAVKANAATNASTAKVLYDESNSTYSINADIESIKMTYGKATNEITANTTIMFNGIDYDYRRTLIQGGGVDISYNASTINTYGQTDYIYGKINLNASTVAGRTEIALTEDNNTYENMETSINTGSIKLGKDMSNPSTQSLAIISAKNPIKAFLSLNSGDTSSGDQIKLQTQKSSTLGDFSNSYIEINGAGTYTRIYPDKITTYHGASQKADIVPGHRVLFVNDDNSSTVGFTFQEDGGAAFRVYDSSTVGIMIAHGDIRRTEKWEGTNENYLNDVIGLTLKRNNNNKYITQNASTVKLQSDNKQLELSGDDIRRYNNGDASIGWFSGHSGYQKLTEALAALIIGKEDLSLPATVLIPANSSTDVQFLSHIASINNMLGVTAYNCGSAGLYVAHIKLGAPGADNAVILVIKNTTSSDIVCSPTCRLIYSNLIF